MFSNYSSFAEVWTSLTKYLLQTVIINVPKHTFLNVIQNINKEEMSCSLHRLWNTFQHKLHYIYTCGKIVDG